MTTDHAIVGIREALQTGASGDAQRAFLALPAVTTDFADLLDVVLHDAYATGSISIEAAIAFLAGLDQAEWTLAGVAVLHSVHLKRQACAPFTDVPVFRLARCVEDLLANLRDDDAWRARAEMLYMEWFGPTVRAIASGEPIQIESRLRREILYAAADDLKFDAARRFAFTWNEAWYHDGNQSEHFVAEPVDDSWTRFVLRSVPYDEYLVAERVEDESDPQHARRSRVFCVDGSARDHVRAEGIWMLRSRDGTMNRDVFELYNPHANEYLQSPSDFFRDTSRRFVTAGPTRHDDRDDSNDDRVESRQWCIMPLQEPTPLERALESFFQADYTKADQLFRALVDPSADPDTRFCNAVLQLASQSRRGQLSVNEAAFEALESRGGTETATRLGVQDLWAELAANVDRQRQQDPASNPCGHVERNLRRASRLVAAREFESAHGILVQAIGIASECITRATDDTDRHALHTLQVRARLDRAKLLVSLQRADQAIMDLDALCTDPKLPSDIVARALLWKAKCERQRDTCDWGGVLKLLRRAFDTLAASDTVADGLRHSIVLEMVVANVAHESQDNSLPSPRPLSAERVLELCRCPISLEVMADPVVTPSGVSYEREMIKRHLEVNGPFDPMTHATLTKDQLYPNRMLRLLVDMALAACEPGDMPAPAY